MLVTRRARGGVIEIGEGIRIKVLTIGLNDVTLGVEAPGHRVRRGEVAELERAMTSQVSHGVHPRGPRGSRQKAPGRREP